MIISNLLLALVSRTISWSRYISQCLLMALNILFSNFMFLSRLWILNKKRTSRYLLHYFCLVFAYGIVFATTTREKHLERSYEVVAKLLWLFKNVTKRCLKTWRPSNHPKIHNFLVANLIRKTFVHTRIFFAWHNIFSGVLQLSFWLLLSHMYRQSIENHYYNTLIHFSN